jgi:hypothetical protein
VGRDRGPKHTAVVVDDDRTRASSTYVDTEDRNDSPFALTFASS